MKIIELDGCGAFRADEVLVVRIDGDQIYIHTHRETFTFNMISTAEALIQHCDFMEKWKAALAVE